MNDWIFALSLSGIIFILAVTTKQYLRNYSIIDNTGWPVLLIISIYLGSLNLNLSSEIESLLFKVFEVTVVLQIAFWMNSSITSFIHYYFEGKKKLTKGATHLISILLRSVLWIIVLLFILQNLDYDVGALLTGLGIGGIAIALAVQNILTDISASLSIVVDKPFVVGDFIIVEDFLGTVEHIGIKTTQIRSLGGEQIIFSNNDLLKSRIRNYKRMKERRIVFDFRIPYETDLAKINQIPKILKEIINSINDVRFDRAHLKSFGTFALEYEIVYYVLSSDFTIYMDIQQEMNHQIIERLRGLKVDFETLKRPNIK